VPTQQHLSRRPAVHEDDGRLPSGGSRLPVLEQLTVYAGSVGCLEDDALRRDQLRDGKIRR
jgi:hypothetical protein